METSGITLTPMNQQHGISHNGMRVVFGSLLAPGNHTTTQNRQP